MWKLYDDLYIGIPSGIRIAGCIVGREWTCVSANGNVGFARTLGQPGDPEVFAASFVGEYLRETGNHMKWDSPARASVGVAALNAWYNTEARAKGLCAGGEAFERPEKTAFVGDEYVSGDVSSGNCVGGDGIYPLPKAPDFDRAAYQGLKDYEAVVISADALTTRALPGLLDIIGEGGTALLEGYSLPCTALFFAFGMPVKELKGAYCRSGDKLLACAQNEGVDPAPGLQPFVVRPL